MAGKVDLNRSIQCKGSRGSGGTVFAFSGEDALRQKV